MFEATFENRKETFEAGFSEGGGQGVTFGFGDGLKFDEENRILSVDIASEVAKEDARPVSSQAVWDEIGDIEAFLKEI